MSESLSKLRKRIKKKKPAFRRQEGYRYKKLSDSWRRPRGRHSKLRKGEKARGKKPSVGYRLPAAVRNLGRNGYKPVLVSNRDDLGRIEPEKEAAVIRSAVGKKKRTEIVLEAEKLGIKLLNAYKVKIANSK